MLYGIEICVGYKRKNRVAGERNKENEITGHRTEVEEFRFRFVCCVFGKWWFGALAGTAG